MISTLIGEISINPPKEFKSLIRLLHHASDENNYKLFLAGIRSSLLDANNRWGLLEIGLFSDQDFLQFVHACGDGSGTHPSVLSPLLSRLVEWGLVFDQSFFGPHAAVNYKWNYQRIRYFHILNILDNVLLDVGYVARKYISSVPAILVSKDGTEYTGTGFVAAVHTNPRTFFIVTAKHNIDSSEGVVFKEFGGASGENFDAGTEEWQLHPTLDIAAIRVRCIRPVTPIFPIGTPSILRRTISLGYPTIATTDAPYLLAHGGELNAVVNTYYGETRLIISNLVAPGNSGGPVLDGSGLCIGMVVNSFETAHQGGIEKASSAIPSSCISEFLELLST